MRPPENLHRKPRNTLFSVQYFVPLSANSECIMKDTPLLQLGNISVQTGTIAACYDYLSSPTFMARCFTLPYLYAGKMQALVYRAWQRRIKGRDWYDFEWYVRHQIPLDYQHLQERIREFSGEMVEKEEFMRLLREKLSTSDIELVKQDVTGFIDDPRELDIWSNDYFLQLADMIVFK